MRKRIWTICVGLATVTALVAIPAAMAAYTSPTLHVTRTSTGAVIKASLDPNDDPTASVRIYAPAGTQLTTTQAPGTNLGPVRALVKALDLAGADLPIEGQVVVAAPGQVSPTVQAACIGTATPIATWVLALSAAGVPLNVPAFLIATSGAQTALSPAYLQICLGPPDVSPGTPGRANFGAKLYSAELTVNGVFGTVATGAWVALWTPYNPGVGTVNAAATVAAPAAIAPGAVSLSAKRTGAASANISGTVTQGDQPRGGATVTIFAGAKATGLKRLGRAKAAANGKFTFKARRGTFFRANVVAAPGAFPPVCTLVSAAVAPIPCVNPTVNGFTAQSRVVRKR